MIFSAVEFQVRLERAEQRLDRGPALVATPRIVTLVVPGADSSHMADFVVALSD